MNSLEKILMSDIKSIFLKEPSLIKYSSQSWTIREPTHRFVILSSLRRARGMVPFKLFPCTLLTSNEMVKSHFLKWLKLLGVRNNTNCLQAIEICA
jgi:hypothetical protein